MVIRDVQPGDQGTYICQAQNGVGVPMAAVAVIKVLGKTDLAGLPKLTISTVSQLSISI